MTIINVFQSHDQNIVVPAISHTELPVLATILYGRLSYLLKAILYPELSFLLRYTTSLSTLILQDFCKILKQWKNVLKIVLIIVNIYKDENKSLISNQFSLKNDPPLPHFLENYFAEVKIKKLKTITNHL